jgi:hypothetical protein
MVGDKDLVYFLLLEKPPHKAPLIWGTGIDNRASESIEDTGGVDLRGEPADPDALDVGKLDALDDGHSGEPWVEKYTPE